MDATNLTSDLHAPSRKHKKFWTPYSHLICQPKQYQFKLRTQDADNRQFFRKWTESTSTSPSGRHLGHYKALLSLGPEQEPPIKPLADAIIQLQLQLSNVALTYGHVYDRWKNIVLVMIERKPGLFLLEKLRTIDLFEADYNWLLGLVLELCMVYSAEEQHQLLDSQWGARPGRSTEQLYLYKTMSYEISRLTRTPLGTLDKDAKACYY